MKCLCFGRDPKCWECGGSGVIHCCEGECVQPSATCADCGDSMLAESHRDGCPKMHHDIGLKKPVAIGPHPSHTWQEPVPPSTSFRCRICGAYRHLSSGFFPCEPPAGVHRFYPGPRLLGRTVFDIDQYLDSIATNGYVFMRRRDDGTYEPCEEATCYVAKADDIRNVVVPTDGRPVRVPITYVPKGGAKELDD